jgi:hypothetical protein
MNPPNFDTWQYENLVKFAEEAYERLREQAMIIEQLRIELKETRNDKFH